MRYIIGLMLVLSGVAYAGNTGVLVEHVAQAQNRPAVVAAIKQAFVGRKWVIESSDEISVTASIDHRQTKARMKVWLDGSSLHYDETSTRLGAPTRAPSAPFSPLRQAAKLDGWLENIRLDVAANVAGIPAPASPIRSVSERLNALEALRASGAVTEDEYMKKRAEIVRDL
jgi:hypothetical protein